jgi:ferrochelatase
MNTSKIQTNRGILLVNLGSPDSTSIPDLRRYLHQFLMDGRVIDVPYPLRKFIVTCMILPFRPKRSAQAYRSIWTDEGSPLIALSRKVHALVQEKVDKPIELAMRYGNPSIRSALSSLLDVRPQLEEILVVPLYPHYAMSSYESSVVEVQRVLKKLSPRLPFKVIAPFYDRPEYIDALVASAGRFLSRDFDHLLFSYHGLPERHLRKSDPTGQHCLSADCCSIASTAHETCYRHQVLRTTELFVEKAGIPEDKYSVAFQSRLGRDKWLAPATADEIPRLARSGIKRLCVICPAFVTDCLETLEEIGIAGKESFLGAGGDDFEAIPCLNDHPAWIDALATWCSDGRTLLLSETQTAVASL